MTKETGFGGSTCIDRGVQMAVEKAPNLFEKRTDRESAWCQPVWATLLGVIYRCLPNTDEALYRVLAAELKGHPLEYFLCTLV